MSLPHFDNAISFDFRNRYKSMGITCDFEYSVESDYGIGRLLSKLVYVKFATFWEANVTHHTALILFSAPVIPVVYQQLMVITQIVGVFMLPM